MASPKYPHVHYPLTGKTAPPALLVLQVWRLLQVGGVPAKRRAEFVREASAGDRDHTLDTIMAWVRVS